VGSVAQDFMLFVFFVFNDFILGNVIGTSFILRAALRFANFITGEDKVKVRSQLRIDSQEHGEVEVVGHGEVVERVSVLDESQELSHTFDGLSNGMTDCRDADSVTWEDQVNVAGKLRVGIGELVQVHFVGLCDFEERVASYDTFDDTAVAAWWVTRSMRNRGSNSVSGKDTEGDGGKHL
jgi:hypothetical protein